MTIAKDAAPAAILFDLDGTLVDSLPDLLLAMNALLAELGRRQATATELRGWVGDGVAVLVERGLAATGGLPDSPLPALVASYLGHYKGHTAVGTRPYPGVEAALRRLREAGHVLGVCTNKPSDLSVELLDALGLSPLFAAIVGGDRVAARKPDPRHLWETLKAMGAEGRRAVMVGDSGNDVAAARAAGIPVVAVGFGYAKVAPGELGADLLIDDFAGLPAAVSLLLGRAETAHGEAAKVSGKIA